MADGAGFRPKPNFLASIERALLRAINQARKKNGLAAVRHDDRLEAVARQHSRYMTKKGVAAHRFDEHAHRSFCAR